MKTIAFLNDSTKLALVNLVDMVNQQLNEFYQRYQQDQILQINNKQDNSPVTEADLMAHELIEQALIAISPDIPVLSEESASYELRHEWQQFWLVDPLDGTREFINKTGEFTVNIALIEDGNILLSMIGIPTLRTIYFHQQGEAVYRIDNQEGQLVWQTLAPKPVNLENWQIAMSRRSKYPAYQHLRDLLAQHDQLFDTTNAGSAYKFCLMFEGEIDVYPRFHPTSEWDTASGQGILEALGGGLYDLQGKSFRYNKRHDLLNGYFIAVRHNDYLPLALKLAAQAAKSNN